MPSKAARPGSISDGSGAEVGLMQGEKQAPISFSAAGPESREPTVAYRRLPATIRRQRWDPEEQVGRAPKLGRTAIGCTDMHCRLTWLTE